MSVRFIKPMESPSTSMYEGKLFKLASIGDLKVIS
jgi:hypothetical protein